MKLSWCSFDLKWQLLIDVASFNNVLMKIQVSIFCCFYSLRFSEVTFEWQLEILIPKISQNTQENTRSRVHSLTSPPPMISESFGKLSGKLSNRVPPHILCYTEYILSTIGPCLIKRHASFWFNSISYSSWKPMKVY